MLWIRLKGGEKVLSEILLLVVIMATFISLFFTLKRKERKERKEDIAINLLASLIRSAFAFAFAFALALKNNGTTTDSMMFLLWLTTGLINIAISFAI